MAFVAAFALLSSLPAASLAKAAEPVTFADWMRQIFVTPDREIDLAQKGVAAAPPPPGPPPALDTSSQPIPKEPHARPFVPRFYLPRETWRRRPRNDV